MTTSMTVWHRTMRTPQTTSTERERAVPLVCQRSVCLTSFAHTCTVAQAQKVCAFTSSTCAWSSVRSLQILPFYFLAPFLLPPVPEELMVNLHNSANESMDSNEFSLSQTGDTVLQWINSCDQLSCQYFLHFSTFVFPRGGEGEGEEGGGVWKGRGRRGGGVNKSPTW